MGNQQSEGVQFCSGGQMYTCRSTMGSYKSDVDTRVGYNPAGKVRIQAFQTAHQQMVSLQQGQEPDLPVKRPEVIVIKPNMDAEVVSKPVVDVEITDRYKDDLSVFEGVFGKVIIHKSGLVLYTDITGKKQCEKYSGDEIVKVFPMGISQGGLTKSIWFKDAVACQECFDLMNPPPSYNTVMANPTKYAVRTEHDLDVAGDDVMKVFEGIRGRNVVVHAENIVLYTDITGNKHCVDYNKHNIMKCFPNGICFGGLKKSIWLKDEVERDLCFMRMQWNMEDVCDEIIEESSEQKFTGLYGGVCLHSDSQIEYTSLSGDRMKSFFEPSEIQKTFPQGISYGGLPKTVWFQDNEERQRCFDSMRKM